MIMLDCGENTPRAKAMALVLWMVVTALLVSVLPAKAQNPADFKGVQNPAALQIAINGDPALVMNDPVQCALVLTPTWGKKDAKNFCASVFREKASLVKKINNEAADATKNNHPNYVVPSYGYGSAYYGAPVGVTFSSGVTYGNGGGVNCGPAYGRRCNP